MNSIYQIEFHCPKCFSITPIMQGITACLSCSKALPLIQTGPDSFCEVQPMTENERCARALGYRPSTLPQFKDEQWIEHEVWCSYGPEPELDTIPDYAALPHILEDEIERRGLQADYVQELYQRVPVLRWPTYTNADVWLFLRATGEQRRAAFLAAVEG